MRHSHAARCPIEGRVLVRMQPHHIADWQSEAANEHHNECARRPQTDGLCSLKQPSGGEASEHRKRRDYEHEMAKTVVKRGVGHHRNGNR